MLTNLGGTDLEQRPNRAAITKKAEKEGKEIIHSDQTHFQHKTVLFFISTWEHKAMKVKSSPSLSLLSVKAQTQPDRGSLQQIMS